MADRIVNLRDENNNIIYPVGVAPTGTVNTTMLADSAVSTAKIADLAVTTAKLAANSVTTAKLAANSVTAATIADSAVTANKIASLGGAYVNAGNVAAGKTPLTSLTVTQSGTYRITGSGWVAPGSATESYFAISILVNGVEITRCQVQVQTNSHQSSVVADCIATVNAGDTITMLSIQRSYNFHNVWLIAQRWLG